MAEKSKKSVWGIIYKQLCSIKLAIILLILLGILSFIAILLGEFFPTNFMNWEMRYAEKLGVFKFEMFQFLGVFSPYNSFWFQIPLVLLVLNIIVCTFERTKGYMKLAFKATFRDSEDKIKQLKNNASFNIDRASAETTLSKAADFLKKRGFSVQTQNSHLFASKGGFARTGFVLFHLGLVITLIGGLLISVFGHTEYLWGAKGAVLTPTGADFSVRVDEFKIETNDMGQVKDYVATLTVLEDSQEVKQKKVEVNYPLRHNGYTFYQSSYRSVPNQIKNVKLKLFKEVPGQNDTVVVAPYRENLALPGLGVTINVQNFVPDFRISGDSVFSASSEARNPAVQVIVHPDEGEDYMQWLFAKFPQFHKGQPGSVKLQFVDFDQALFTGLQVSRKPGSLLVWIGLIGMTIGLVLSFYIFHRRYWVMVQDGASGKTKVFVGGHINKNEEGFKIEFKELIDQLKKSLKY